MQRLLFTSLVFTSLAAMTLTGCITNDVSKPSPAAKQALVDTANFTTMMWVDSVKELGKVKEGPKIDVVFRFRNTGNKPLVIASVQPGCGCTVADKPEKPFLPGEEGEIKAVFDTKGRAGINNKSITVMANTRPEQSHQIKFNIEVVKE